MIITIDGPSASGKSTVARMLAQKFGYYYVCSGFLYRSLAYLLVHKFGYKLSDLNAIKPADVAACFDREKFEYTYDAVNQERIFFDGVNITPFLKDSFMDKAASIVGVDEGARHFVTALQHAFALHHDIVTDGRDVGSAVFPDAPIKFFLTASVEVRAQRWLNDQKKYDNHYTLQQAIEKITDRDQRDKVRSIAPLVVSQGAIVIDNSLLTVQQTFEKMVALVEAKL
jgi:cytidylate kinase